MSKVRKNTKKSKIAVILNNLEVNQKKSILEILTEVWEVKNIRDSYSQRRSFDVIFSTEKAKLTEKEFRCINGNLTRIK